MGKIVGMGASKKGASNEVKELKEIKAQLKEAEKKVESAQALEKENAELKANKESK